MTVMLVTLILIVITAATVFGFYLRWAYRRYLAMRICTDFHCYCGSDPDKACIGWGFNTECSCQHESTE